MDNISDDDFKTSYEQFKSNLSTLNSNYQKVIELSKTNNYRNCLDELNWLQENGKFEYISDNFLYAKYLPLMSSHFLNDYFKSFIGTNNKNLDLFHSHINQLSKCNNKKEIIKQENLYLSSSHNFNFEDNEYLNCVNSCIMINGNDSQNENIDKGSSQKCLLSCKTNLFNKKNNIIKIQNYF